MTAAPGPGPAGPAAHGDPPTYNPYNYAVHEDPYPLYARLRADAPVYRNEELDFWALSRHGDVLAAFRDVDSYSNAYGVSLDPAAFGPHAHRSMSFLAMDPPAHTRLRSLVGKSFTVRRVAAMEPRIRQLCLEHLEPALEAGGFDFIGDFAGRLPMDVISDMVGVPAADRAELRRLADLVVHRQEGVDDVPPQGAEAALALVAYYADMVAERRRRPRPDLTSDLLGADLDGDRLTDEEAIAILFLMVVAGNETTTKLLGNAWYWAWRHPGEAAKVFGSPGGPPVPERVPDWVEETLRFDNSTQMLVRVARRDLEVGGVAIPEGHKVLLLIGSANRDEEVFSHPDRYDLDRDTQKLISFGGGRHFCLGAPLARLEARVALEELASRVAGFDVDGERADRVHSINVRGFATLPTTVRLR